MIIIVATIVFLFLVMRMVEFGIIVHDKKRREENYRAAIASRALTDEVNRSTINFLSKTTVINNG